MTHAVTPASWIQKLAIVLPILRSLTLSWSAPDLDVAFPGLIKILKALAHQPNCIDKLFLILQSTERFESDSDGLPGLDWEMLDQVLANRSSFPRLKKLTIHLPPSGASTPRPLTDIKEIQAKFEETKTKKFPRLAVNDYLDFKFLIDEWRRSR